MFQIFRTIHQKLKKSTLGDERELNVHKDEHKEYEKALNSIILGNCTLVQLNCIVTIIQVFLAFWEQVINIKFS